MKRVACSLPANIRFRCQRWTLTNALAYRTKVSLLQEKVLDTDKRSSLPFKGFTYCKKRFMEHSSEVSKSENVKKNVVAPRFFVKRRCP